MMIDLFFFLRQCNLISRFDNIETVTTLLWRNTFYFPLVGNVDRVFILPPTRQDLTQGHFIVEIHARIDTWATGAKNVWSLRYFRQTIFEDTNPWDKRFDLTSFTRRERLAGCAGSCTRMSVLWIGNECLSFKNYIICFLSNKYFFFIKTKQNKKKRINETNNGLNISYLISVIII